MHTVCFVTGAPGAGKTLLGLDLALKSRSGSRPGALLSGNRPLVHVLTEALATDRAARTGESKSAAKYQADAAIQNLLGYLKEHTDGAVPPEHVIIFDEAQRAWDAEVGQELMGRPNSEPELFLKILGRLEWSCLVCLVGYGQEINRGEGGLRLWGEALAREAANGNPWRVLAASPAIEGGPEVAGDGLTSGLGPDRFGDRPRAEAAPREFDARLSEPTARKMGGGGVERGNADAAGRVAGELAERSGASDPRSRRGQGIGFGNAVAAVVRSGCWPAPEPFALLATEFRRLRGRTNSPRSAIGS